MNPWNKTMFGISLTVNVKRRRRRRGRRRSRRRRRKYTNNMGSEIRDTVSSFLACCMDVLQDGVL
jgi:hypothetical protein